VLLIVRLAISVGIAILTGLFVSLLVFGPDIDRRLDRDFREANAHLISDAVTIADADIQRTTDAVKEQSAHIATLSGQVSSIRQNEIDPTQNDVQVTETQSEINALLAQKVKADSEIETLESYAADEKGGIKSAANNSGIAGAGARYRAAQEKLAAARTHAREIDKSLDTARSRLDALRRRLASDGEAVKHRSDDQLPGFEQELAAENAKLDGLQTHLANLTQGREASIRRSLEASPDYVKADAGFLAKIRALEKIANEDTKIGYLILVFELVAGGLKLGAIVGKVAAFCPTTYSAMLAKDVFMRAVRIVDEMTREMNHRDERRSSGPEILPGPIPTNDNPNPGPPAADGLFGPDGFQPPVPPKRPRGRPRKSPPNGSA
jgi:predicted  nucleic acid-binding Zn-ribbon protein